jgi:dTMP kinase
VSRRGRWIAFEGGEGSGKSTQARRMAAALDAVLTREPGGTVVGQRIRDLLLDPDVVHLDDRAEALLMAADRAQHVSEVVAPALEAGRTVVSDRSAWSSLAYQGHGRGLDPWVIWRLCDWAMSGLWPDVVVFLDAPASVRAGRMADPPDRLEAAGHAFHERLVEGFAALAALVADRWLVIAGSGSVDDGGARVDAAYAAWTRRHG